MISMEMAGKIRRVYFHDEQTLHGVVTRTGMSCNTIQKRVRAGINSVGVSATRDLQQTQSLPRNAGTGPKSRYVSGKAKSQER